MSIFVLCVFLYMFSGCTSLRSDIERVSELRDEVFAAQAEGMSVTLITGIREEPFVIDGKSGEKKDFSVLTVIPSFEQVSSSYSFELKVGEASYRGEMKRHPLKSSWSYELDVRITDECSVTISTLERTEELTLASVKTPDTITVERAYTIACAELDSPDGEIYIRLLENPLTASGGYYWYVAFIGENYALKAVLLEPLTGEVVAKRE